MKNCLNYIKRHRILWIITFLFTCLCHGTTLLSTSSGIDLDAAINGTAGNGLDLGRYGFFLLHYAMGNSWFNMFYTGALSLVFLTLAGILWSYLYVVASNREEPVAIFMLSAFVVSATTLTMHLFFKSQDLEMTFAFCLMAVVILILMQTLEYKKDSWWWLLLSVPTVLLFSTYQVFYAIFIFGVVSYLFLRFLSNDFLTHTKEGERWMIALKSAGLFLLSFIINQVINSMMINNKDYFRSQILWGSEPLNDTVLRVGKSILACLLGYRPYFTWAMFVFDVVLLVACIWKMRALEGISSKVLLVLDTLVLLVSPFALTILLGQAPALRAQLVYPFFMGFMGFYLFSFFRGKKLLSVLLQLVCILGLVSQFSATQRLNYTDAMRYAGDVRLANDLDRAIQAVSNGQDYPIAFYGHKEANLNQACMLVSEPISTSVFDWDWILEPMYYASTVRAIDFMNAQGLHYQPASEQLFYDFVPSVAADMPCFPAEGSVIEQDGVIVIKLSEHDAIPTE